MAFLQAAFLGLVEGLTEFLPVSSTGHLLLVAHFLGLSEERFGPSFVILIQFGAILAILSVYFGRLWAVARALPHSLDARLFVIGVLVAFLPAAILGALFGSFIKGVLFNPLVVCVTLILGGIVLLVMDARAETPVHDDAMRFPPMTYLKIGLFQCLALVPGVSRSGATIVGAMLMGASKRAAAEFSFFLAMPTMAGAFAYEAWKARNTLTVENVELIAVGFLAAFVSGVLVVRTLLDFVSRRGFAPFAYWRILVGSMGLAALLFAR